MPRSAQPTPLGFILLAKHLAGRLGGRRTLMGWSAPCPVHSEGHASLEITPTDDNLDLTCSAGCDRSDIIQALLDRGAWPESKAKARSRGFVAAPQLLTQEIQPIRWAIDGILPEGLTMLAGKPKMGKSWMALGLSLAVASGGRALSSIPVQSGDALYLALEDNHRRLQQRCRLLLQGEPAPSSLAFRVDCPKLDEGGIDLIQGWLQEHPAARLVVVDTFKRVRPRSGSGNAYDEDYDALFPLATLSHRSRVAILVVHHLRKDNADDPVDALNGSTGLAAAVDGLLILERMRGQADAVLHVVSREAEEGELALTFDPGTATWSILGDAEEYAMSQERRQIVALLQDAGPLMPREIADALGKNRSTVRVLLRRMARAEELRAVGLRYTL